VGYNPAVTKLLEQAVDQARRLPDAEQDAVAHLILHRIESDRQWDELLAKPESDALLERMAQEARREHQAGTTRRMD
jgi:hypothetical protein